MALKYEGQGREFKRKLGCILPLRAHIFFFVTLGGLATLFVLVLLAGPFLLALTALLLAAGPFGTRLDLVHDLT